MVAIAASTVERASAVASREGVAGAHGDWRELIERDDIDLVSIAVPPVLQRDIAVAAAHAGKHLLCEKPIAATTAAAQAIVAAARHGAIRHAVDFEFPELPEWRQLYRLVHDGELGTPSELRIDWSTRAGARRSARSAWKDRDEDGGGALGGFVSHALYHALWLCGPLEVIDATLPGTGPGTTACSVTLRGAAGRVVVVDVDTAAEGLPHHVLEIMGTGGTARLESVVVDHAGPFGLTLDGRPVSVAADGRAGEDRRVAAVGRLVGRFIDAIRQDRDMRPDLRDGHEVVRLIEATRVAAGRP